MVESMANLYLPREFNARDYAIGFVVDGSKVNIPIEQRQYIKLVGERVLRENSVEQENWVANIAPQEWRKKYGELPEYADFYFFDSIYWAETTSAGVIPYDGTMILTKEEQETVYKLADHCDLTMGLLYIICEGLKWRPSMYLKNKIWPPAEQQIQLCQWDDEQNWDGEGALNIALTLLAFDHRGNIDDADLERIQKMSDHYSVLALSI